MLGRTSAPPAISPRPDPKRTLARADSPPASAGPTERPPGAEFVIERYLDYLLVEKVGDAAWVALELDARTLPSSGSLLGAIGNRILTSVPPVARSVMAYSSECWAMSASPHPRPGA
jgi:hypothetical protein